MRVPIVGLLVLAFAACGGSPSGPGGGNNNPPGGNNPPQGNTVTISGSSFAPGSLAVDAGETVTWNNTSGIEHTITPVGHSQWTGITTATSGEVLSVTFSTVGTFGYECLLHPMSGQIVVR